MRTRTKLTEIPAREFWPAYMRREDLAAYLRCVPSSIDKLRMAGKLPPGKKLGRTVLWSKDEIDKWIAQELADAPRLKGPTVKVELRQREAVKERVRVGSSASARGSSTTTTP